MSITIGQFFSLMDLEDAGGVEQASNVTKVVITIVEYTW